MPPLRQNLSPQLPVDLEDVAPVDVVDDAPVGQLGEGVEVVVPLALGVEQRLVAVLPELLDDRLERGPVVRLELARARRTARSRGASRSRWAPAWPGSAVVRPTWHRCGISASQAVSTLSGCVVMSIVRPT